MTENNKHNPTEQRALYEGLSVLSVSQIEREVKAGGSFVLPVGSSVMVQGIFREDPTRRVDLGILELQKPITKTNYLGTGTKTDNELSGMKFAFFSYSLDAEYFKKLKGFKKNLKGEPPIHPSFYRLSNLEIFFMNQGIESRREIENIKPQDIDRLIVTTRV